MPPRFPRPRSGFARLALLSATVAITVAGATVTSPLPDAVIPSGEPVLAAAVYAGMGLVLLWFGKLGIDLKAGVERLILRVEDPHSGLVTQLDRHIHETRGTIGALSNELEEVKQEVATVGATCAATHQRNNGSGG